MSTEKNRPNRGWRGDASSARPKASGKRAWQEQAEQPVSAVRKGWSRRTKLWLAALGFLLCVAGAAWLILELTPRQPARLVLLGADYEDNLAIPHNEYGWQALEDLADWANSGGKLRFLGGTLRPQVHNEGRPFKLDSLDTWQNGRWAEDLGNCREETVVFFLEMHGGADSEGAYLLPQNADPGDRQQRLSLDAILTRLGERDLQEKKKVLLLDPTQVTTNAQSSQGMLFNDFVRKLKDKDDEIRKIDNLVVLCSTDVNQRSWVSEEWKRPIFAHYVREGLRGGALTGKSDNKITAKELFDYVRESVTHWVLNNRSELQTPILLPSGDAGRDRAGAIVVALPPKSGEYKKAEEGNADESPKNIFGDEERKDIQTAWEGCAELQGQVPAPAVYAPRLWRRYRQLLLRYEQMVRAGQKSKATALRGQVNAIEEAIKSRRAFDLSSLANSLRMPDALGGYAPWIENGEVADAFDKLWDNWNDDSTREANWENLQKLARSQGSGAERLMRVYCANRLLDKIKRDRDRALLTQAFAIMRKFDEQSTLRPAELHFAYMYHFLTNPDAKVNPSPLAKVGNGSPWATALDVRREAEEAACGVALAGTKEKRQHPYSETVYRWVKPIVEQADEERRLGEDLLFAPPNTWADARKHLEAARKGYLRADEEEAVVRRACSTRDKVLADLPYYSQWVARRRTTNNADLALVKESVKRIEELWKAVHQLTARLEESEVGTPKGSLEERTRGLKAELEGIDQTFGEVAESFDKKCAELDSLIVEQHSQDSWHEIEDLLVAPVMGRLNPALRADLVKKSRGYSRKLNDSDETPGAPPKEEEVAQRALQRGAFEGRLALARLGQEWFEKADNDAQMSEARRQDYDVVLAELKTSDAVSGLIRPGEQLGHRWRRLSPRIDDEVRQGVEEVPAKGLSHLLFADRLARLASGVRDPLPSRDPTEELRRLTVHRFLIWQAERTHRDRWYGEKDEVTPYYMQMVDGYLKDAAELMGKVTDDAVKTRRLSEVASARERLKPMELSVSCVSGSPDGKVVWTSERLFRLKYQWRGPLATVGTSDKPRGIPVYWMTGEGPLPADAIPGELHFVPGFTQKGDDAQGSYDVPPLALNRPGDLPTIDVEKVRFNGLYRGQRQRIMVDTPVKLHLAADMVAYQHRPPSEGCVAARAAEGTTPGYLSIILDASGSMNTPKKYPIAVKALAATFDGLPADTTISLRVFGQEEKGPGTQVLTVNHPTDGVQQVNLATVASLIKWKRTADQRKELVDHFSSFTPKDYTPLLQTIRLAKEELDKAGAPDEPKVLLVLTDGLDSDLEGQPREVAARLKQEFADSGISLNVVLFGVSAKETDEANKAFRGIEEFATRGKLWGKKDDPIKAGDFKGLADALREAVKPKLRFLPEAGKAGDKRDLDLAYKGDGLNWSEWFPTKPTYRTMAPPWYSDDTAQNVKLDPGQRLILKLSRRGRKVHYERGLYGDEPDVRTRPQDKHDGNWRFLVLSSFLYDHYPYPMRLVVALEDCVNTSVKQRDNLLEQQTPAFAWFEVAAQGHAGPLPLTMGSLGEYPAPAWYLEVPGWYAAEAGQNDVVNQAARPSVKAWCSSDHPPTAETLTLDRAQLGIDKEPVPFSLAGGKLAGTVSLEMHAVKEEGDYQQETRELDLAKKERRCLVVRLIHPRGERFAVRVNKDVASDGHEHRYYRDDERYTALFWLTGEQMASDTEPIKLEFFSLDKFLKQAESEHNAFVLELPTAPQKDFEGLPPVKPRRASGGR